MCVNILQSLCQCADVQGLLAAVGKKDYLKYLVYLFEMSNREMEKLSQLHGKPITAQTCVVIQCSFSVLKFININQNNILTAQLR